MHKLVFSTLMVLLFWMGPAAAAGLPGHYPKTFDWVGTIDSIDGEYVVIGDLTFEVGPSTRYSTPNLEIASLAQFRIGQEVGCDFRRSDDGRRVLTHMWLVPRGAVLPEQD